MPTASMKSIDHYEAWLGETVQSWSPAQRVVFAAAMAERWFPTYEAFSAKEKWGDPATMRRSIEAMWNHAGGKPLAPADLSRHLDQLADSTPHMDDFDALDALAAAVVVHEALKCCQPGNNLAATVMAALSGFEAAVPDWAFDLEEQPKLWKKIAARKELRKQIKLVEEIGGMPKFDGPAIKKFRLRLTGPELIGEASPSEDSSKPAGITNQQAFEQYRSMLQMDLKTSDKTLDLPGVAYGVMRFAAWMSRYSRRRQTIDGSYGKLADVGAHVALTARQRARDALEKEIPTWDSESAEMIDMCYSNNMNQFDAKSPFDPHGYGLSMRRLWAQAKRAGKSDAGAWENIVTWAIHRPAAWEAEDRRKKKGQAYSSPELGTHIGRELNWAATGDVEYPWSVEVDGKPWRVRLNDFPDDLMYTLIIGETEVGSFHDWPGTWHRG